MAKNGLKLEKLFRGDKIDRTQTVQLLTSVAKLKFIEYYLAKGRTLLR